MTPACTVVVPTRNRRASLARLLAALARQTAVGSFDVVVVPDGSTDDSDRLLATWSGPFDLTVVPLAPSGREAARNAGAARARARVVLFFDDDVEPEPGVVAAHLRRHGTDDDSCSGWARRWNVSSHHAHTESRYSESPGRWAIG